MLEEERRLNSSYACSSTSRRYREQEEAEGEWLRRQSSLCPSSPFYAIFATLFHAAFAPPAGATIARAGGARRLPPQRCDAHCFFAMLLRHFQIDSARPACLYFADARAAPLDAVAASGEDAAARFTPPMPPDARREEARRIFCQVWCEAALCFMLAPYRGATPDAQICVA